MRRRKFITLIGGAAAAWPLIARAQQKSMPVIGFLNSSSPDAHAPMVAAFRQGLKETDYVEGQNVAIEFRWAEGQYDRLADMAADLVRRQVSVIAANGVANLTAKTATSTIPIVFTTGFDPVQLGLVASLNRPGGNVTGVTQLGEEVAPKRVELAHELVPMATVIALLVNPRNPSVETLTKASRAAAATLGLQLDILRASTEAEVDDAFMAFVQSKTGVLMIATDPFFAAESRQLAALSLRHSVPAISPFGEFTAAGGLISYGGSLIDSYRLAGVYTGRILKGEKPADLPVQQPTKFELVVNLKAAKAIGLAVPPTLLARADQVIE
jgi:putative tryptophan/tyrosine transport system substrate-binding protein